jgi:7-cyano-7-deazaguanine synthase
MRQAIVLLSGGLDSATTLYIAKKQKFRPYCLIFDYGQRHKKEIYAALKIARAANCPVKLIKINLPWKGSALLDKRIQIPKSVKVSRCQSVKEIPSTYVPGRNIIFLSFALSYAEAQGAQAIFIGAHAQDYSGYPDCRPEFYRAFSKVISSGTKSGIEKRKIKIYTPLIQKTKAEIIRLGSRLGVPFEFTWSCYKGGVQPCGRCDSCYFRQKGFRGAGIEDPLLAGTGKGQSPAGTVPCKV